MNTPTSKDHIYGMAFAFSGFSLFAFADAGLKFTGQIHTPMEIGFWTQFFGLWLLIPLALIKKWPLKSKFPLLQVMRGGLLGVTYLCLICSFKH